MTTMPDLADFLLARIAEDEAPTRDLLSGGRAAKYRHTGSAAETWSNSDYDEDGVSLSPDRWVAECEAKRQVVEHHARLRVDEFPLCAICTEVGPDAQGWPCFTLKTLALPYADHPDYRSEWRP